ncbi:hypothetical protein AQ915_20705 [Burkholderia pseudomallei]|uniref:hypothetical protein n=1 Tax=Burkholderia pseudomallei TaxID=28450 RepID=UPI00097583F0|nr:hypothetical protein [Burkholderia pseudomallei]ONC30076.1 hypothetical protein AQ915_20705 [Burkholderia pseudomallei]
MAIRALFAAGVMLAAAHFIYPHSASGSGAATTGDQLAVGETYLMPTPDHDPEKSDAMRHSLSGSQYQTVMVFGYPDLSDDDDASNMRSLVTSIVRQAKPRSGVIAIYVRSQDDADAINTWAKAAGYKYPAAWYRAGYRPANLEIRVAGGAPAARDE